ncbi:Protocadherin Fat 4 [Chamberlinius hualienensis]
MKIYAQLTTSLVILLMYNIITCNASACVYTNIAGATITPGDSATITCFAAEDTLPDTQICKFSTNGDVSIAFQQYSPPDITQYVHMDEQYDSINDITILTATITSATLNDVADEITSLVGSFTGCDTMTDIFILVMSPVNDHQPKFEEDSYTVPGVPESFPSGFDILEHYSIAVTATDTDTPNDISSNLDFQITGGDDEGIFSVSANCPDEPNVCNVVLKLTGVMDYSKHPQYDLIVQVTDEGNPPQSSTTTITIILEDTDNLDPAFEQDYYYSTVTDLNIGKYKLVFQPPIKAHDQDTALDEPLIYSLVIDTCGSSCDTIRAAFTINSATGEITFDSYADISAITNQVATFGVKAEQSDNSERSTMAIVNVNLPAPTTTTQTTPTTVTTTTTETTTTPTTITTCSTVTYPDTTTAATETTTPCYCPTSTTIPTTTVTYTTQPECPTDTTSISTNTSPITVTTNTGSTITVTVSDSTDITPITGYTCNPTGPSTTLCPESSKFDYTIYVSIYLALGTKVATVSYYLESATYSLDDTNDDSFKIDPTSGDIKVNNFLTVKSYDLKVKATKGTQFDTTVIRITANTVVTSKPVSTTGYIAGISVLGVLLVIAIIVCCILGWKAFHHKSEKLKINDDFGQDNDFSNHVEGNFNSGRRPSQAFNAELTSDGMKKFDEELDDDDDDELAEVHSNGNLYPDLNSSSQHDDEKLNHYPTLDNLDEMNNFEVVGHSTEQARPLEEEDLMDVNADYDEPAKSILIDSSNTAEDTLEELQKKEDLVITFNEVPEVVAVTPSENIHGNLL